MAACLCNPPPRRASLQKSLALDFPATWRREVSVGPGSLPPSPTSPSRFQLPDGHSLAEKLGGGRTAVVYRVERADGKSFAAKCVNDADEEVRNVTTQEYELLSSFKHSGIVQTFGLFSTECSMCLLLEFCEQGSIPQHLERSGLLEERPALRLFRQLIGAVDFLHQRRIVHRDVKPDNCLLTDGARFLKLTDFNSAKVIGQGERSEIMLSERGTKDYSAPEVLLGGLWNERVDIWASGLCLFFMVNGSHPWPSLPQAKKAFAAGCLPPVQWTVLSPNTADLLQSCLVVNAFDRPPAMKILNHGALQATSLATASGLSGNPGAGTDSPATFFTKPGFIDGASRCHSKPRSLAQTYGALCNPRRRVSFHGYTSLQSASEQAPARKTSRCSSLPTVLARTLARQRFGRCRSRSCET